jgi:hypothetical protein
MILTKIYINNEQIDLTDEVSIPLNFNIADIREPEKRSTTWSKTVVLPGTTFNNELFSNIWNVNAVINSTGTTNFTPNFNPNLKAVAEITYNEATQFKGICQLLNVNVTDKYEIQYEVCFYGSLQNIYQDFTNGYLRDIDLTEYNHNYTLHNQFLSWSRTNGYVYPHIDYGKRINSQFKVEDIYPAVFVKTLIDKMFSLAGYTYQSNFFETDAFKKLIIPYNGQSLLSLSGEQIENRSFRAEKTTKQVVEFAASGTTFYQDNQLSTYSGDITFEDETTAPNFDPGNNFNFNTYFKASRSGNYKLKAYIKLNVAYYPFRTFTFTNSYTFGSLAITKSGNQLANIPLTFVPNGTNFSNNRFNIRVSKDGSNEITYGELSSDAEGVLEIQTYLNANEQVRCAILTNSPYYFFILPQIDEFDYAPVEGDLNIASTSYFTGQLLDSTIQEGDTVILSDVLPDNIKQSDFFNSIIKAFNLFVEVDKSNEFNLLIEPRPTFYSSGTVNDWSDKLDYSKETKIIPMGEINNKTYLFTYKDDKDYFNTDYQTKFAEIYGQKKYDIQNDFLKGEVKTELIFSPTPLVDTIGHDRVISKIYTLDNNGAIKFTPSNIRLLYYGGLKTTTNTWQHIATSGTTIRSNYAYAGHLDDVQNPTFDLSFTNPRQVYYTPERYTTNNLYNKYWKDYIEQIADKDSKIFVGYFLINEFDIQSLDFRNTFYFENDYWRLNKIIDYDISAKVPTKCEFIKLKTLPPYVDDIGFNTLGGVEDNGTVVAPTGKIFNSYNDNFVTEGAIVSGMRNQVNSGEGVIVIGSDNTVGLGSSNVSITASTGVTLMNGVSNVSVTNSSGITVTESNVTYNNGIKTLNNVSYKHYIALLSQTGTSDPIVDVLENTLTSGITWLRTNTGEYEGTLIGEFTFKKTTINCSNSQPGEIRTNRQDSDKVNVYTYDSTGTSADGQLLYSTIEIRVYS